MYVFFIGKPKLIVTINETSALRIGSQKIYKKQKRPGTIVSFPGFRSASTKA
jgi:hypothetical protein